MATQALRLIFMGTPDFAVPALRALIDAGHEVCAVYCQPPRPSGRGQRTTPSPVQRFAEDRGLTVRHPTSLKGDAEKAEFAALGADLAVVAAYGLILPRAVLEAPRLGCLNIHASLLPRWRGAAPIQRAMLAGDSETGVTIMQMDVGLDTGAMLLSDTVPIGPQTTASDLHDSLADMGARLVVEALAILPTLTQVAQPENGVTYASKLTRDDGCITWSDATMVDRQVRALTPWPGAWFTFEDTVLRVKLATLVPGASGPEGTVLDDRLTIACNTGGAIRITRLQRPGKAAMDAGDLLRGYPIPKGSNLSIKAPCPDTP